MKQITTQLQVLIVAASSARRASLAHMARHARRNVVTAAELSLNSSFSAADLIVADLDSQHAATALLDFLKVADRPQGVVALIDEPEPGWLREGLRYGANAVISRETTREDLTLALEAAEAGLVLLHPSSASHLFPPLHELELSISSEHLTPRELEVLQLLSEGLANKEVAARLNISEHTAKFHISSILGKLAVSSRTEAVSKGIRSGLIAI